MTDTPTLDLDQIRARHEAATPGPWTWNGYALITEGREYVFFPENRTGTDQSAKEALGADCPQTGPDAEHNLALLVHARDDIARLLAEVDLLRARVGELETAHAAARALHQPTAGIGYDCDEDDTPGSYGAIASACTTCGTPDEHATRYPCPTARALGLDNTTDTEEPMR